MNITIIGEINSDTYAHVFEEFTHPKPGAVQIILNSEGGSATDAIAIADLIRKYNREVNIHAAGLVASAAVIILAAGTKGHRTMDSAAWLMTHEEYGKLKGRVSDLERQVKVLRRQEDQWNSLLEAYTGTSSEKWRKCHEVETWHSAEEALRLGIIDKIIYSGQICKQNSK